MTKSKIVASIAFLLLVAAGSANAGGTFTSTPGGTYTGTKTNMTPVQMGRLSNNVTAVVVFDSTTYAANTKHLNGTKMYGSSSGDTKLFAADLAAGTATPSTPSASDSTAYTVATTWSSL